MPKTKRLPLLLPLELYRRLKLHCAASDVPMTEVGRRAIEDYLSRKVAKEAEHG